MGTYRGQWHGNERYFGLHYDLHAGKEDTELGLRASPEDLVPTLKLMGPDFVQTDCKGHPGLTSWFSRTPGASVSPGVKKDALEGWRAATRELGMPLHCHYSGIWDKAVGEKHPDWCIVGKDGKGVGGSRWTEDRRPTNERLCSRSPYLEEIMLPQLFELIDRYNVDGFWVDGEIWAVDPCYCARCRRAFKEATGIENPPAETSHPDWVAWINFTRQSFEQYVTRYCEAIHAHKPGVLVCSNYIQTIRDPGEPRVPTDWLSGDNTEVFGLDIGRCQARFMSTRGKPWDLMIWASYRIGRPEAATSIPTFKPVQMIQQEAAVTLALGGMVQVYDSSGGLRDGRLIPWRMALLRQVARFARARKSLCQGSETIPQMAVLHSEHHTRSRLAPDLWEVDIDPVLGATYSMLENHYGVDVMDEWALKPRLSDFAVVVVPEQDGISSDMVNALKTYVEDGGKLLVSGTPAFDRFGGAFLGVGGGSVESDPRYNVSAGEWATRVHSTTWRLVEPKGAKGFGTLGSTPLLDERLADSPAATINRVGKGAVAYVPFDVFRFFAEVHYPMVRRFLGDLTRTLAGRLPIRVEAPTCVDVVLRRKAGKTIVHLINRASGIPSSPNDGAVDEIPFVGPVTVELKLPRRPASVTLAFEEGGLTWKYDTRARKAVATLDKVHIHEAVVVG